MVDLPDWAVDGTLDKARRDAIIAALEYSGQRVAAAAKRLKIGRSTLYRLIAEFEIEVETRVSETLEPPIQPLACELVAERRPGKLVQVGGEFYMVR